MSNESSDIEKLEALALVESLKFANKTQGTATPAPIHVIGTATNGSRIASMLTIASQNQQSMSLVNLHQNTVPTSEVVEGELEQSEEEILALQKNLPDRKYDNIKIGESVNITDVQIPERMLTNMTTGFAKVDILMAGDGVTPSTICLLTGVPGSGKTTFSVQLADSVTKQGHIALYNMCEESLIQLAKTAKRLHIKDGFFISSHRSVFDLVEHALELEKQNPGKQVFIFADSLQTLELPHIQWDELTGRPLLDDQGKTIKAGGRIPGEMTAAVTVTRILSLWAKNTFGICFVVGQVNKDGVMSGKQAIKHWVDVHMHLTTNSVGRYLSERICEITKNRFGIANIFFPYELEGRGIKFLDGKVKK